MSVFGWHRHGNAPDVAMRYIDGDGKLIHTQFHQDVEPLIEENTRERNETGGWSEDRSRRKIGSIPVSIVWEKEREWEAKGLLPARTDSMYGHALNHLLVELLRDRDYEKFRTVERV